jgi:hypothetical protein
VLQIAAGFTESITPADGFSDAESLADQMIEGSISSDDIPPVFAGGEFDICLALDRSDGFPFDERQIVAIGAFLIRLPIDEGPRFDLAEISVTPEAASGDGLDVTAFGQFDVGLRSSEDVCSDSCPIHTQRL